MGFKTNSSKASEGSSLKPEGDYEILIESAEVKTLPSGTPTISFRYVIRNDVGQGYKNGKIFHNVWKKKEPNEDDLSVDGFNFGQLMAIAKAAALPDGQDYASLADFLAALIGKPMRVHLFHRQGNNGNTYENIDHHYQTEHPGVKHKTPVTSNTAGYAAPQTAQFANSVVSVPADDDDDYPF